MTDSADQLAAASCRVIDDAVHAALRAQPLPEPPPRPPEPPKTFEDKQIEWLPGRMLYPLKEVQQRLSIGRSTVYQLVGNGQLPSVKIGRRRFVTAAALGAFIQRLSAHD